jgi:steroid 5-alpha reductase family enzyme
MKNNLRIIVYILVILIVASLVALAATNQGMVYLGLPIIFICMITSFIIHWLVFIPSYFAKTEKYYDLTGSISYLITIFLASFLTIKVSGEDIYFRSLLLVIFISVWTLRLGLFLFSRIMKSGEDKRFREIKISFFKFFLAWTISGLWVFLTSANALTAIINNMESSNDYFLYIGSVLWITGLLFEVIADEQKKRFKADPENTGEFITQGLWSISRHPNYFGEIILWFGITIISFPTLQGWQLLTLLSPVFVYLLLTHISGINLLEKKANKTWGSLKRYQKYKERTPKLFPFLKLLNNGWINTLLQKKN